MCSAATTLACSIARASSSWGFGAREVEPDKCDDGIVQTYGEDDAMQCCCLSREFHHERPLHCREVDRQRATLHRANELRFEQCERFNRIRSTQDAASRIGECHEAPEQAGQRGCDVGQAGRGDSRVGECPVQLFGPLDDVALEVDDLREYLVSNLAEWNIPGQFEKRQANPVGLFKRFRREVLAKVGHGENHACKPHLAEVSYQLS
jgi:hypothetical protein